MSNLVIIILIIVVVVALIIGPLFMLEGNGRFNIPKGFKNKQGYDQDEDDWAKDSNQSAQNSSENKPNENFDDKKQK